MEAQLTIQILGHQREPCLQVEKNKKISQFRYKIKTRKENSKKDSFKKKLNKGIQKKWLDSLRTYSEAINLNLIK